MGAFATRRKLAPPGTSFRTAGLRSSPRPETSTRPASQRARVAFVFQGAEKAQPTSDALHLSRQRVDDPAHFFNLEWRSL